LAARKQNPKQSFVAPPTTEAVFQDVQALILATRERMVIQVNSELALLYWDIGERIRREILGGQRAAYGKQVVATLAQRLKVAFGRGFTQDNLSRMIRLAELFPDRQIVGTLSQQLSWSHFVEILPLSDPLQREFYATMCRAQRWSVRGLQEKIRSGLYERTLLSRNTNELVRQELAKLRDEDRWTPDMVFRDPYLLSFLELADIYDERQLEDAILREIESFLLELGEGFTFVARQKRMVIDGEDFKLDLLFFHRKLRRLVAIELKIGKFEPGHKGQMEFYLAWLDQHERESWEEPPVGIILCTRAGPQQMALLQIGRGDIHVAEYVTQNLPPALMRQKLHEAEMRGREQIARRQYTLEEDLPELLSEEGTAQARDSAKEVDKE